jgi:hypothetical protein
MNPSGKTSRTKSAQSAPKKSNQLDNHREEGFAIGINLQIGISGISD